MARRKDFYDYMTMIEKGIFSMIVISFSIMAITQVLLQEESWRNYLNFASRLESQKVAINEWQPEEIPAAAEIGNVGYIDFQLEQFTALPNAYILVNGREVKRFTSDKAIIQVKPGDIVEIDGTYYNRAFQVKINDVSKNLNFSNNTQTIDVNQNIVPVTKVEFVQ